MKNWRTIQDASGTTVLQRRVVMGKWEIGNGKLEMRRGIFPAALGAWETVAAGDVEMGEAYCAICATMADEKTVIPKYCDGKCGRKSGK